MFDVQSQKQGIVCSEMSVPGQEILETIVLGRVVAGRQRWGKKKGLHLNQSGNVFTLVGLCGGLYFDCNGAYRNLYM